MRLCVATMILASVLSVFSEPIHTLFDTGVGADRLPLAPGAVDPHYIQVGADPRYPGPSTFVVRDGWPIIPGVWMVNNSRSQWIAPRTEQSGVEGGNWSSFYLYTTQFDLSAYDISSVVIRGRWASDNFGREILFNGKSTGFTNPGQFAAWSNFVITNGFEPGTNTLSFLIYNGNDIPPWWVGPIPPSPPLPPVPPNPDAPFPILGINLSSNDPTGLRVEFDATGCPKIPVPYLTSQPADQIVAENDPILFSVGASTCGNPLSFQWRKDGTNIPGATQSNYLIPSAQRSSIGTYSVVLSNIHGTATSREATLTVGRRVPTLYSTGINHNRQPLPGGSADPHYTVIYSEDFEYPGPESFVIRDGFPVPPWINRSGAKWIAPRPEQNIGNAPGRYVFRTQFVLDGVDTARLLLAGKWSVDNFGPEILLNDVNMGISNTSGFGGFSSFEFRSGFKPGLNVLDFVVSNAGSTVNPTGLRAELTLLDLEFGETVVPKLEVVGRKPLLLRLHGKPGLDYRIEYNDFLDGTFGWEMLRDLRLEAPFKDFGDPAASDQRFYRAFQFPSGQ